MADRRIISKRCMVEYIPSGNSGLPLKGLSYEIDFENVDEN
jgi:hypothetical protein